MLTARHRQVRLVLRPGDTAARAQAGGKGFHLRQLAHLGMPVPPWIVLTTRATDAILAPVRGDIAAMAGAVDEGSTADARALGERIAACIRAGTWPDVVRSELSRAVRALPNGRGFAVRSSAVSEDGRSESYAGVFHSLLGVRPENLEVAVRECLTAAFGEPVAQYRREHGLRGEWPRFAVVIQEMVDARVAGVAFTADPRTGEPRQIVVAGYGLGAGIVGDLVETDAFERVPGSEHWTAAVRRKEHQVVADGAGGTVLATVALHDQERPALSDAELDLLSRLLVRVEQALDGPQDVEWALDRSGALHVLQARPISAAPGDLIVWDDSNIGESYPGITLPLTYSLVRRTYERLFTRALEQIGVPQRAVASLHPELGHLIGIVHGHLYMNLLAYYRLFAAVPGIGWTVGNWERGLGIRDAPDAPRTRPAAGTAHRRSALAVRVWWRLVRRLYGLDGEVERFGAGVEAMLARHEGQDLARWPFDRLLACFESLVHEFLDNWTILIFNDLFAFLFTDRLARLCGPSSAAGGSDLHQRLLTGLGRVASIRPLQGLRDLAAGARRAPAVAELVWSDLPARETWKRLGRLAAAVGFREEAAAYLTRYGDRAVEELKLETVPLSEEPWTLVDLLRSMSEGTHAAEDRTAEERERRTAAERAFQARWAGHPVRLRYAVWVLQRARRSVAARENMSFARARAYGLLRRLVRAMGTALVREGALSAADDICYATFEDLEGHARAGLPGARLGELIAMRKDTYRSYGARQPPHRISCRGTGQQGALTAQPPVVTTAVDSLTGIPCSPGQARGVACVVHGGVSPDTVRGRILVARVTEPGWVFLMSVARGVVVERGSILSHAAIIGRELGVPTIVGAAGAATAIRDGDEIEMNGSTGEVRILRRAGTCSD